MPSSLVLKNKNNGDGKKKLWDIYNHLDRILACDRQMDGQICHGIVRAMHSRRAVKNTALQKNSKLQ